jgi:hypothetical protein
LTVPSVIRSAYCLSYPAFLYLSEVKHYVILHFTLFNMDA